MGTLAKIRRLYYRDKLSIKEICRQTGLSRNTVRSWLRESEMKEPVYPARRVVTKLDAFAETLGTWLKADAGRNKRERRTKGQMWQDLRALGYEGSYGRLCAFARAWKINEGLAANKGAFIPLKFAHGEAFQFDWSTEYTFIGGLRRRVELAHTKLCSSRAFWLVGYPGQGHEMLFDAHARAFEAFGGVPQRGIYDNMKTAVDQVLSGKKRKINSRFESMAGHYLFEPEFCNVASGWEKGIVEKNVRDRRISLIERKPGALRNGAPFEGMPEPLKQLQAILLRRTGGDSIMAQVLAAVPIHGLQDVLVAVELALEAGKPSGEHVLNVLARLKSGSPANTLNEALAGELAQGWPLQLREEPLANVDRYDDLRVGSRS